MFCVAMWEEGGEVAMLLSSLVLTDWEEEGKCKVKTFWPVLPCPAPPQRTNTLRTAGCFLGLTWHHRSPSHCLSPALTDEHEVLKLHPTISDISEKVSPFLGKGKKIRTSLSLSQCHHPVLFSQQRKHVSTVWPKVSPHKFQEAEIIVSQNMPQNPLNPESDNHHYYSFISSKHLRMGRSNSHWDCLIKPSISWVLYVLGLSNIFLCQTKFAFLILFIKTQGSRGRMSKFTKDQHLLNFNDF